MKDGQMTTVIVHSLLSHQKPTKQKINQSQSITMQYEQYSPPNYRQQISQKIRSRSFYEDKKRHSQQRRKFSKYRKISKQLEKDQQSMSEPKIIDLQFSNCYGAKVKKQMPKTVLSSHDYCSLMFDSMQQYMRKIQKEKRKRLQRCEKIKNFGLNIQSIKARPDMIQVAQGIERKQTLQQRPSKSKKNQLYLSDIGLINNDSNYSQTNSKSYGKTISTTCYSNSTNKNSFISKKMMFRSQKKQDQNRIAAKLNRMFSNYSVILSSFGVVLDRSQQKLASCTDLKAKKFDKKFTYYVGKGNNKNLIVSILKKRWWWVESDDIGSANFVWTQLKIANVLQKQASMMFSELQQAESNLYDKANVKTQYQIYQNKQIYNIFHKNHSPLFYYKLNSKNEKKYLRKMKVPTVLHNHYQANYMLGNKKALYYNMLQFKKYKDQDLFQYIPLTFHVQKINSKAYKNFQRKAKQQKKCLWIVKPGQNSNRGQGIFVSDSVDAIKNKMQKNKKHTYIIQKYIKNNLTFQRRKFDIRTYLLMVSIGGVNKFYWYSQGYLRTSSQIYNLSDLDDPYIHLTNDAIQANGENYGKFQKGNKVTYSQFQRYLDINYPNEKYSVSNLVQKMKSIAKQVVEATYFKIDPCRKQYSFELFGLDFLIDGNFKPWLLQVNTNPCLELSSPVLERLIPRMVQNLFRIVVDPIFRPTQNEVPRNLSCYIPDNIIENNRFQLIFDCLFDRDFSWEQHSMNQNSTKVYEDQNQQFENDGEIIKIQD